MGQLRQIVQGNCSNQEFYEMIDNRIELKKAKEKSRLQRQFQFKASFKCCSNVVWVSYENDVQKELLVKYYGP
jgi:hypothetical protein